MPKVYWVNAYRAVNDADKLAAYAKLAGPAITAGGGRFLVRGDYQAALAALGKGAERDIRIIEGL